MWISGQLSYIPIVNGYCQKCPPLISQVAGLVASADVVQAIEQPGDVDAFETLSVPWPGLTSALALVRMTTGQQLLLACFPFPSPISSEAPTSPSHLYPSTIPNLHIVVRHIKTLVDAANWEARWECTEVQGQAGWWEKKLLGAGNQGMTRKRGFSTHDCPCLGGIIDSRPWMWLAFTVGSLALARSLYLLVCIQTDNNCAWLLL